MTIYTIGYTGKTDEQFANLLISVSVDVLVDVRANTFACQKSFKYLKSPSEGIHATLQPTGAKYLALRKLGNPFRRDTNWQVPYCEKLNSVWEQMYPLIMTAGEIPCLMCTCPKAEACHRWYIAKKLLARGHNMIHL